MGFANCTYIKKRIFFSLKLNMFFKDRDHFSAVKWSNIVVDEAHRLKSEESLLYKVLQTVESKHRLLLTGTPLQNSLKELWCLLSYIRPVNFEVSIISAISSAATTLLGYVRPL